jgi:hypothetical protein
MVSFSSSRVFTRSVFAFIAVFCLSTALLFTGCSTDPDEQDNTGFIPTGEWVDDFGSGYDITNTTLEYYTAYYSEDYPGENTKGIIKEAIDFSQNAGVLLIQISESTIDGINGKFIGVYYKDYTSSHVFLANAIDEFYALIVMNTLTEAKNTFTVDNVDTHVTYWGSGYSK